MILAMDIGNTNTVLGAYDGDELVAHWQIKTDRRLTADQHAVELAGLFALSEMRFSDIKGVAVASVVPPLNLPLQQLGRRYFNTETFFVEPGVKTGISIQVEDPRSVGADRIANCLAAWRRHGRAVIIVDFGTATTFDVLSGRAQFLGGAIAPGIAISTEALFQQAAALPRIELTPPPSAIGRNTITNMQSGIIYGFAGQVDAIVSRIQDELGEKTPVIATGGLGALLAGQCETVTEVDPFLTLYGVKLVYERNRE